ncbi:MAG: hypothetical protein ACTSVO_15250 [Candidatus Heimdallarchaeaceae archaeon]
MIILKVKDKGTLVDIPGTQKVRSPVEIDISKVDIGFVTMYLRKQGIENYEIISVTDTGVREVLPIKKPGFKKEPPKDDGKLKANIESRFNRLEGLIINFLGGKQNNQPVNSEQITDKLENLEKLSEEIIRKQTVVTSDVRYSDEPQIEELDDKFIPDIDLEGMTMKGSTIKTVQSDSDDADETADLLSSIVKKGG